LLSLSNTKLPEASMASPVHGSSNREAGIAATIESSNNSILAIGQ
jgi:hypothetical protein